MAVSGQTFSDFGGAVSDLFAVSADRAKAAGDLAEATEYGLAASFAEKEAQYTAVSTQIQEYQEQRALSKSLGDTSAGIAGAGFSAGGSGLDLLRDSAAQGAMQQAVTKEQGLITEEGYEEQAQSYRIMQGAAEQAAQAEKKAAIGAEWTAGIKIAAGIASIFTGGGISSLLGGSSDSGAVGEPMSLAPPPKPQFGPFMPQFPENNLGGLY
jgi:hypothetical protein